MPTLHAPLPILKQNRCKVLPTVETTGALATAARRTLKKLANSDSNIDKDDEANLRLVCAIKTICPGLALTTGVFKGWKSKISVFRTDKRMAWIQSKDNLAVVPPEQEEWLLPPNQTLGSVDTSRFWVFDYHTPSGLHLKGSTCREIGVSEMVPSCQAVHPHRLLRLRRTSKLCNRPQFRSHPYRVLLRAATAARSSHR